MMPRARAPGYPGVDSTPVRHFATAGGKFVTDNGVETVAYSQSFE
jgi:hypothetical protein